MSKNASHLSGEGLAHKRIVVVDDNEILLRAWKKLLTRDGFACFATTNPEAALEHLEQEGADLLICDIVMPRMDGFELLQRMQRMPWHPRIVLTTGYVCDFKRLKLDVGEQDVHVLLKPYGDIQEILRFIHRLMDGDETLDKEQDSYQTLDDARVHLWSL